MFAWYNLKLILEKMFLLKLSREFLEAFVWLPWRWQEDEEELDKDDASTTMSRMNYSVAIHIMITAFLKAFQLLVTLHFLHKGAAFHLATSLLVRASSMKSERSRHYYNWIISLFDLLLSSASSSSPPTLLLPSTLKDECHSVDAHGARCEGEQRKFLLEPIFLSLSAVAAAYPQSTSLWVNASLCSILANVISDSENIAICFGELPAECKMTIRYERATFHEWRLVTFGEFTQIGVINKQRHCWNSWEENQSSLSSVPEMAEIPSHVRHHRSCLFSWLSLPTALRK